MKKRALVTGVTGQDGSYLLELLLEKDYEVVGLVRRSSVCNLVRLKHLINNPKVTLVEGEVCDSISVYSIIENGNFDEVYNLAAQSHVKTSFEQPLYTFDVNTKGPLNFLEAIHKYSQNTRFYQASTSEMFGKNSTELPDLFDGRTSDRYQDEDTPFAPQSPYACAKLAAHDLVRIYRDGYGLYASCGILFNHESERRGEKFVTRKITQWVAGFYHWSKANLIESHADITFRGDSILSIHTSGEFPKLRLGNLDAFRDWGHAEDYVRAMWMMLQQKEPEDFVIATGKTYSVRNFLAEAFNAINIRDPHPYFVIDPEFYRPAEVEFLCGKPTKALEKLGWKPTVSFEELVQRMVWSDINGPQTTEIRCESKKVCKEKTKV